MRKLLSAGLGRTILSTRTLKAKLSPSLGILAGAMKKFGSPSLFLGALMALAVSACSASAAVLVCGELVAGDGREHASELEAKKAALAHWQEKAGTDFPWRLAANKAITCLQTPSGKHLCKAAGHPCVLRQVPPEGGSKRLMPARPGQGT